MESKIKLKKSTLIGGIIFLSILLLVTGIYIASKAMAPSIKYNYYINGILSDMVGTNLSNYECNDDVEITFDTKYRAVKHSNLKKKTKCNLYFQETIGSYIYNYIYAHEKDDSIYTDINDVVGFTNNSNNYVYFNCDDYTKTDTCELWRIIEIKKVLDDANYIYQTKLIRNDKLTVNNIDKFSWNDKGEITEFNTTKIGKLLNDAYYNGKSNYEYIEDGNVKLLDFTKVGLKNLTTRSMLLDKAFKMENDFNVYITADSWYKNEAYGSSIDTLVGLPSISDYVLTKMNKCKNMSVSDYKFCEEKSYLDNDNIWFLNYYSENNNTYPFHLENSNISSLSPTFKYSIYPTIYLNQKVLYNGGNGSSKTPYLLKLEESN